MFGCFCQCSLLRLFRDSYQLYYWTFRLCVQFALWLFDLRCVRWCYLMLLIQLTVCDYCFILLISPRNFFILPFHCLHKILFLDFSIICSFMFLSLRPMWFLFVLISLFISFRLLVLFLDFLYFYLVRYYFILDLLLLGHISKYLYIVWGLM